MWDRASSILILFGSCWGVKNQEAELGIVHVPNDLRSEGIVRMIFAVFLAHRNMVQNSGQGNRSGDRYPRESQSLGVK